MTTGTQLILCSCFQTSQLGVRTGPVPHSLPVNGPRAYHYASPWHVIKSGRCAHRNAWLSKSQANILTLHNFLLIWFVVHFRHLLCLFFRFWSGSTAAVHSYHHVSYKKNKFYFVTKFSLPECADFRWEPARAPFSVGLKTLREPSSLSQDTFSFKGSYEKCYFVFIVSVMQEMLLCYICLSVIWILQLQINI